MMLLFQATPQKRGVLSTYVIAAPKDRLDSQFIDGLNENTEIMAYHLAQNLVDLSGQANRSGLPLESRNPGLGVWFGEPMFRCKPLRARALPFGVQEVCNFLVAA